MKLIVVTCILAVNLYLREIFGNSPPPHPDASWHFEQYQVSFGATRTAHTSMDQRSPNYLAIGRHQQSRMGRICFPTWVKTDSLPERWQTEPYPQRGFHIL